VDRAEPERVVRDTGARVLAAGRAMLAGTQPQATAALAQPATADPPAAAQVAVLDTHTGPLADRGIVVAFDHDPGGRQAALHAYQLLAATGAWPTTATLPEGQDPAARRPAPRTGGAARRPEHRHGAAGHLVVDERLARWTDRLHWVEGQLGAARDVAGLIATLPPDQIGRQVLRVADRLGLDPAGLTRAVVDAVSRDGDAPGRLQRRNRRADLDRGVTMTAPATAAQFARTGYPAPPRSVAPGPVPPPVPAPARPAGP